MNDESIASLGTLPKNTPPKPEKKKKSRPLVAQPIYTKGEEIFNVVSHIVGGALGIIIMIASCIIIFFNQPTAYKYIGMIIFGLSVTILYTMSALYHAMPQGKAKRVFRVFDHCTIFLLIAGTYTPYCMIAFHGMPLGSILLGLQWGIAAIGITFNAINMNWKAVKILSMVGYMIMGWSIILTTPALLSVIPMASFIWLLAGGLAYSIGVIFFAIGPRKKYFHSIWHLFDLAGTIMHFISILFLIMIF